MLQELNSSEIGINDSFFVLKQLFSAFKPCLRTHKFLFRTS